LGRIKKTSEGTAKSKTSTESVGFQLGLSLFLGLWVRPASVVGALYMVNLTLATWWGPGHAAPFWRYFGAELDHLPLLLLFVIFYATDAGKVWGLDGRRG